MRVFVAGASGVIGRRLVPRLVDAGHAVWGMTRQEANAATIRALGAEPVLCDAFDHDAVARTLDQARPDVLVHQLTDIPPAIDPRRYGQQMASNDRLRTVGTRNLMDGAVDAGIKRVVAQSIAFVYAPGPGSPRTEQDPLFDEAPPPFGRSVRAIRDLETAITTTAGIEGVVLRYGFFYGPGTAYASDGSIADLVRRHRFPLVGAGTGVWSFVHVDDAAQATALATEHAAPGIYNIVDDEPAPAAAWLPAYAQALHAKPPIHVPTFAGRLRGGTYAVFLMTEMVGASNAKAKEAFGWKPEHPSWRTSFATWLEE